MPAYAFLEPGGLPTPICSKLRKSSGPRSGRAPGRERSSSRGRSSPYLEANEPRGRSVTRMTWNAQDTRSMGAEWPFISEGCRQKSSSDEDRSIAPAAASFADHSSHSGYAEETDVRRVHDIAVAREAAKNAVEQNVQRALSAIAVAREAAKNAVEQNVQRSLSAMAAARAAKQAEQQSAWIASEMARFQPEQVVADEHGGDHSSTTACVTSTWLKTDSAHSSHSGDVENTDACRSHDVAVAAEVAKNAVKQLVQGALSTMAAARAAKQAEQQSAWITSEMARFQPVQVVADEHDGDHSSASACVTSTWLKRDVADAGGLQSQTSISFLDYMQDMLDLALSGEISNLFGAEEKEDVFDCEATEEVLELLPPAASLKPCMRPSFRKRLRPREVPNGTEIFPMDCLPSTPACTSAPTGPTISYWAAQMQSMASAEDVGKQVVVANSCAEGIQEPVPHQAEGCLGARPGLSQSTPLDAQQVPNSSIRRRLSTPRRCLASKETHTLLPSAPSATACSFVAPVPPSAPAPGGRASSYRRPRAQSSKASTYAEGMTVSIIDKPLRIDRKHMAVHTSMSPRPPSGIPPPSFVSALRNPMSLESSAGGPRELPTKSAMSMDLGEEVATKIVDALPQKRTLPINLVSKGHAYVPGSKQSMALPPIWQQPTWSGIEAGCDTWRSHKFM